MPKPESGSHQLNQLLIRMNLAGGFPSSVLTDKQGLAIASASGSTMDADRQSAAVAFAQRIAEQVVRQIGMGATDEITLNDQHGNRLVCRPFQIKGHELILAVIVPKQGASYRRATSAAIREIKKTWKQFWE